MVFVRVYAYRGYLVILGPDPSFTHPNWVPAGEGRIGCVTLDSAAHVAISPEALELLKTVRPGRDSIGAIDWFQTADGRYAFGWLGRANQLVNPASATGSRQWKMGPSVLLSESLPKEIQVEIDAALDSVEQEPEA